MYFRSVDDDDDQQQDRNGKFVNPFCMWRLVSPRLCAAGRSPRRRSHSSLRRDRLCPNGVSVDHTRLLSPMPMGSACVNPAHVCPAMDTHTDAPFHRAGAREDRRRRVRRVRVHLQVCVRPTWVPSPAQTSESERRLFYFRLRHVVSDKYIALKRHGGDDVLALPVGAESELSHAQQSPPHSPPPLAITRSRNASRHCWHTFRPLTVLA